MAYTIALVNEKGGVGKTTTVVNLGAALAERGYRVLGVDLDPHCGLTISLQADGPGVKVGEMLLAPNIPIAAAAVKTAIPSFDLIPSGRELTNAESRLARSAEGQLALKRKLQGADGPYEFILLDCGPSLGLLTINALIAANGVIVPLQSDYLAMRGVGLLLDTIRAVKGRLNPALEVIGFLAAMHDSRTTHAREVLQEMRRSFGDKVFTTIINYTVRLKETPLLGESILTYESRSRAAEAYRALAQEVIQRTSNHA